MQKQPVLLPALAAIFAPPLVVALYFACLGLVSGQTAESVSSMLFLVDAVSLGISVLGVLFWGVPLALLLRKFNYLKWWSITIAGFVGAAIPMSIFTWPVDLKYRSGYSYWNGAKTVIAKINGVPTLTGWIDYLGGVFWIGAFGALAGFVFWIVSLKCSNLQMHTDACGDGEPERCPQGSGQ